MSFHSPPFESGAIYQMALSIGVFSISQSWIVVLMSHDAISQAVGL